jgi:tetratricopeptide (TPR) repeat protein
MNLASALNTAQTTHSQGDLTLAKQQYLAIIHNHDNNDAIYGLATLCFQQQQYVEAISLFEKVQEREPHAADIALYYALCLKSVNKTKKALAVITSILVHIPNDIMLIMPFAQLTFSIKEFALTIKILTKYPMSDLKAKALLASAYLNSEQWLRAQQVYLELVKTAPSESVFFKNLALSSAKTRHYPQAIEAFIQVIKLTDSNSNNHLRFADLYLMAKETNKAREQLNIAIALDDMSLIRYELEIKICRLENNYSQAIVSANKAITIDNHNFMAWQAKAELAKELEACISALSYLHDEDNETTYQNQQNLYTLAKAYEGKANYALAFNSFIKANKMQQSQLASLGLAFNKNELANEYSALSKVFSGNTSKQSNNSCITPNNIFIVGMPRSGTTLVERLLSQDENVLSSGENEALAYIIEHNINQQKKLQVNWSEFFNANKTDFAHEYKAATSLKSNIIIDKMPHNFRYVGAIIAIFNGAKIIQMRRNPQDLALSIFSQAFASEHNYASDLVAIAHAIFQANKLMDFWAEKFPEQVININYEALVQLPKDTASKLYNFCQLQWQEDHLNFYKKNVSSFTFSELQVRQAINTKKINFSNNYKQQLAEFTNAYNALVDANK